MTRARDDLPWFPFYVHRFMSSRRVQRMSAEMIGGYLLLLIDQWSNGPIPAADAPRISKLDDAVAMRLLCDCFRETPDGWVNQALEDVRAEQEAKAQRLSRAGRKGARAKWSPEARTRREELERDWQEKLALVDGVCPRCAEATVRFDRDHIVPKHMGGADTPENIQPLCAWCNSAKGTETVNWLQVYTRLRDSGAAIARLKQGRGKAIAIEEIREEKKKPLASKKRASETPLPSDWLPTAEHRARAEGAGLDVDREAERFRAHASEKGRRAVNWNGAFTRWLMNAEDWRAGRKPVDLPKAVPMGGGFYVGG